VSPLPNLYNIQAASGSQYSVSFTVQNDNGSLANITNKTFELVVRDRTNSPNRTFFSINSTSSTANGTITVNTTTSVVSVLVTPTAVNLITNGGGPYTLWMDPNLSDATALVVGTFFVEPVAAP
jgi:hypothetical protein